MTLWKLLNDPSVCVRALVTTLTQGYDRVAMHSTRQELLRLQAHSIGLPLKEVFIPKNCSNKVYEEVFSKVLKQGEQEGIEAMAFGDLFLEDVREYRVRLISSSSLAALFPVWHTPTKDFAQDIIRLGFKAFITCVDPKVLPSSFAGRTYDEEFLKDLPSHVDPCGENGEFHTFVFDGPILKKTIPCEVGQVVEREGFVFADVLPL